MTERTERQGTAPPPRMSAAPSVVTGRPARGRGGWPAVVSLALGSFALVLSELLPVGALTAIGGDLHVSIGTAGLLVVAPGVAAAVTAPVVAVAARWSDRRRILLLLGSLTVLADLLSTVAGDLAVMLVGRLLLGVALGGFWAIGGGAAARLVPRGQAARASAFVTAGISLGTVVSVPMAAFVGHSASWRTAFLIACALALAALIAQARYTPPLPALSAVDGRALASVLGNPRARIGLLATGLTFVGHFAAYTFIQPYLAERAHFGTAAVTGVLLGYGLGGVAGNFLAGFTLGRAQRATTFLTAASLAGAVVLLPVCAGYGGAVTILAVLWGAAFGAVPLAFQMWMLRSVPQAAEGGMTVFVSVVQISIAAGSLAGGRLVDGSGISTALYVGAGLAALGAAVLGLPAARDSSLPVPDATA